MVLETVLCLVGTIAGFACDWGSNWVRESPLGLTALVAYLVAYIAGGRQILGHAWTELLSGRINVDLLMIAAAIGSAALGEFAEGGALLFLFSLSHTLETLILGRTRRAIADLMDLTPDEALVVDEQGERRVAVELLVPGQVVIVHPGERIPADGVVRSGQTSVDQSPLTGESIPVDKTAGDLVFSGTLNQQGVVQITVSRAAGETTLSRMVHLVEEAQNQRAASQRFTEWFGERYTWVVLALAAATGLVAGLVFQLPFADAFQRAMTVLVVASPCAVVISIPAAILAAITSAARGGVLFKGGAALEATAAVKSMAFDKTGTLTIGRPKVVTRICAPGVDEARVLQTAAALEAHSEHPLARAIVVAADEAGLPRLEAAGVQAVLGFGIEGTLSGQAYRVGKVAWFTESAAQADPVTLQQVQGAQARGETVVILAEGARWLGALGIADVLRPSTVTCLTELRRLGIEPLTMLTGDAEPVAREMAGRVSMDFQAGLLPAQKLDAIRDLRTQHGSTGMIGDGMNDAPSLAAADVGFSLGGAGTDVALETADVVILADDLRRLPYAIALARATQVIIQQNLIFAFGMMVCLLLLSWTITLPLPLAVLGHEGSTVLVIFNGLRLLRFPRPT